MGSGSLWKGLEMEDWNGFSVSISLDPWLPREANYKPFFCQVAMRDQNVASIMSLRGIWNMEMIRASFIESEDNLILQTPLPKRDMNDDNIWGLNKKEVFSVKSAYHLGIDYLNMATTSSSNNDLQNYGWKCFWKAKVLQRLKFVARKLWIIFSLIGLTVHKRNKNWSLVCFV